MPDTNAIISTVTRVEPPSAAAKAGTTKVVFGNGQSATLPPGGHSHVVASVLQELTQTGDPAYVELDPNHVIQRVFIPLVTHVVAVTRLSSGDLRFDLADSAALHVLSHRDPNFARFAATLTHAEKTKAPVSITEDPDTGAIIDIRVAENPKLPALALRAPTPEKTVCPPAPVSAPKAAELYSLVSSPTCAPYSAHAPCIPYLYPDDGCWGRASDMCRLILATGAEVVKLWYYGQLVVNSDNTPKCTLHWIFHVAPLLTVDTSNGPESYVLDPALFPHPVTQTEWQSVLGDPSGSPVITEPNVFLRYVSGWHEFDPTYSRTDKVLATYRRKLRLRAARKGPPPYPCSAVWAAGAK